MADSDNALMGLRQIAAEKAGDIASNTAVQQYDNTTDSTAVQQDIQQYGSTEEMFASTPVVVTIRLPEAVSEWLGENAYKGRKRGVTKQSQIWDALKAYIEQRIEEGR
jgi:hypothetical protein